MLECWLQFKLDYISLWSGLAFLISATVVYLLYLSQRIDTGEAVEIALSNPDSKEIAEYVPWNIWVAILFTSALHCWFYTMKMSFLNVDKFFFLNNLLRLVLYLLYMHLYRQTSRIHRFKTVISDKLIAVFVVIAAIIGYGDLMKTIYFALSAWGIGVTINVAGTIYKLAMKINDRLFFNISLLMILNTFFKIVLFSYRYGGFTLLFKDEGARESAFMILLSISQCLPFALAFLFWMYGKKKLGEELIFFKGVYVPLIIVFMTISGFLISELYTQKYAESEKQSLVRIGFDIANFLNPENLDVDENGKLKSNTGQFETLENMMHSYAKYTDKISSIVSYWKQKNGDWLIGPSVFRPEGGFLVEPWTLEKDPLHLIEDCFNLSKPIVRRYNTGFAGYSISVFVPVFADFQKEYNPDFYPHKAFAVLSVAIKDYIWNMDIINQRFRLLLSLVFIIGVPFLAYAASIARREGFRLPFNTSNSFTAIVAVYIILSSLLIARFANESSVTERKSSFLRSAEGKALFVSSVFQNAYSNIVEIAKEIQILKGFASVKEFRDYIDERIPGVNDKVCLLAIDENNQINDYQNAGLSFDDEDCKVNLDKLLRTKSPQVHCHSENLNGVNVFTAVQILIPLMYDGTGKVNEIFCYRADFQYYINKVMPSIYKVSDYLGFEIFDIESIDKSSILCYPSSSSSSSSSYNAIFPLCFFNKILV